MLMIRDGKGVREVGRFLKRSPGTILRETSRNEGARTDYDATQAGELAICLRTKPRKALKLVVGGELFGGVSRA